MANRYPIVINCRDRLRPLLALISWLEENGQDRIVLVDNASTYPPLLRYYDRTPHTLVRLERNVGHHAPWDESVIDIHIGPDEYFVETDCDVVPDRGCPPDLLAVLRQVLDRHPDHCKVGPGLRIDNLPRWYRHRSEVRRWESQFWDVPIAHDEPGWPPLFEAQIDTTFAMYRPGGRPLLDQAIRTGAPYVARHEPWYANTWLPSREERYYRRHARSDITSWDHAELPERIRDLVETRPHQTGRRRFPSLLRRFRDS